MVHAISKFLFFAIGKVLLRMDIYGRENIPKRGGFILASNHFSNIDPGVVGSACPRKLSYMAKEQLFARGFPSWWMNSVGCIPVKRNAKDLSAIKEAMRRVRAGGGLLLFPEGTRQIRGQETNEPQAGVGFLAVKLGVPVVPAYAKGTDLVLPKGAKKVKFKKVSVRFGEQMAIDPKMSYEDAATLILKKIRELEKIH